MKKKENKELRGSHPLSPILWTSIVLLTKYFDFAISYAYKLKIVCIPYLRRLDKYISKKHKFC